MNKKKRSAFHCWIAWGLATLAILFLSRPATGQEYKVVRDLHLWSGVAVEKEFARNWNVFLGEELRFKHDISQINNYFTEAGLGYRVSRNFAFEAQYRITRDKKKDDSYSTLSRYSLDLNYKGYISFLTIRYRLRYQKEVESLNMFDLQLPYEKYVRNRLVIRYEDLKSVKPYVLAELFQLFEPGAWPEFNYFRLSGGIKLKTGKIGDVNLAFSMNREINAIQPATIYVIKANYTFYL